MSDHWWQRRVPTRFHDAHPDHLTGDVADAVREWSENMQRNLVLLGNVGSGKTYAAIAAARLWDATGLPFTYWSVPDLLDALRTGGHDPRGLATMGVDDHVRGTPLLILDDLAANRRSEWVGDRLYAIVNHRWEECLPIIATSNLRATRGSGPLVEAIGERMYSRLVHDAVTVTVGGKDRRRGER